MTRMIGRILLVGCMYVFSPQLSAQNSYGLHEKGIERLNAAREVAPLSVDRVFGESFSPFNGSGVFSSTDISIPGNSDLPVHLSRVLQVDDRSRLNGTHRGGFGEWDLDLPNIHAVVTVSKGWRPVSGGPGQRCSLQEPPPNTASIAAADYWEGYKMQLPGGSAQAMLASPSPMLPAPGDGGSYPWITKDFWRIGCKPTTKNGYSGEAFIALSPSGAKYHFDWVVVKAHSDLKGELNSPAVPRQVVFFMVTKVEDRFGNWVEYSYAGDRLSRIASNDGRYIDISWSGNNISSAASSVGVWGYNYSDAKLVAVATPDGSKWRYSSQGGLAIFPGSDVGAIQNPAGCPETITSPMGQYILSITSPSNAMATYTFELISHRRTNVPESACYISSPSYWFMRVPRVFIAFTLMKKEVVGPGMPIMVWTYSYGKLDLAVGNSMVNEIWGPGGSYVRNTFGSGFNLNEGQLLRVERGSAPSVILASEETAYVEAADVANQPFPGSVGNNPHLWGDRLSAEWLRPVRSTVVKQQGVVHSRTVDAFDRFARPLRITSSSAPNP